MKITLDPGAYVPVRAHATDAGLDIKSPKLVYIPPYSSVVIDTGVHVEIPEGYAGMLKSKSGLNIKHDITSDGIVDCGFTGSIQVKLYNHGSHGYEVKNGDKITQLVITPIINPVIELVDELKATERGSKGFGSSGR